MSRLTSGWVVSRARARRVGWPSTVTPCPSTVRSPGAAISAASSGRTVVKPISVVTQSANTSASAGLALKFRVVTRCSSRFSVLMWLTDLGMPRDVQR